VGVASLGAVWLIVWIVYTADPRFSEIWHGSAAPAPRLTAYRTILTTGRFWQVFGVTILVNPCLYFNLNWLPTYFAQQRGLQPGRELGIALSLIFLGLDLGYICCGMSARWLARRFPVSVARRLVFSTATLLLCASALVPAISARNTVIAVLMLVNFALGMWIAMYLTMAQEVSEEYVSTAAGLLGGSGSLAGALAMWWVGRDRHQFRSCKFMIAGNELTRNWVAGPLFSSYSVEENQAATCSRS
jgi:pimeloyl-ACP methyl ester carboxylesterase